jgi:hypothetical protein
MGDYSHVSMDFEKVRFISFLYVLQNGLLVFK